MARKCSIAECRKDHHARGMCCTHYRRWHHHGDHGVTNLPGPKPIPTVERFMNHVSPEPNSGCWLWTGIVNNAEYGGFQYEDRIRLAHRVSYFLFKGEIPPSREIDHLCGVKSCVNPDHLEAVSHSVNVRRGWNARKSS